ILSVPAPAQDSSATSQPSAKAAPACEGLPGGRHMKLERMTELFGLTCEQELKIEPLLHNEESVSKPLLRFAAFSPEEKEAMMLQVKTAARKNPGSQLSAEQVAKLDADIRQLSANKKM